ncbi:hypothetical protein [Sutcliffiella rhizosphaerae]|uniref:Uncharacterized protein n=1 Tax=Sutcliffiella rhizosphaerae TaxID=2880967 RepID=A0ABM8YTF9_9BACI|nr:hypothetical protein [Sutcliffiella rhizosphaerae]CAG9623286.1 hypothetical protein BACCIP111883_04087 [Sutcliffiella rhizosphaerae]
MSIMQLTSLNHAEVIRLFSSDIENYYFLINDLIVNNYQGDHFKIYGEYENGELVSILLNNFNNVTYYSQSDREVEIYKEILSNLSFNKLSGPSELMTKFKPYINLKNDAISHMGVVKNVMVKRKYPELEMKNCSI